MKFRLKQIIPIIIIFVMCPIALFFIYSGNAAPEDRPPVFMDLKGAWSVAIDRDIILNVIFADDKTKNTLSDCGEELSISFDNKNIIVQNYELSKGDSYKKMRLYSLVMTARSKEIGKQVLSELYIHCNGKLLAKKSIDFVVGITAPQSDNALAIIENTASSAIFDKYQFSIKNAGASPVILDELLFGSFEKSIRKTALNINGKYVDQKSSIILNPDDDLNAVITFTHDDSAPIKMFAPTLQYHLENNSKSINYNFPFAIYGLPLSGNALGNLYSDFVLNE